MRPSPIDRPLAVLAVAALAACGTGSPSGTGADLPNQAGRDPSWLVRDTGLRCVTHPCFSLEAVPLAGGESESLSDIDLEALHLESAVRDSVLAELQGNGLAAAGVIRMVPGGGPAGAGRVLRVSALVAAR